MTLAPHSSPPRTVVAIFTDGACSGNPGPGGWGAVLRWGEREKHLAGYAPHTTNNRMELMAAIRSLEALKRPCRVTLTTDSVYVKNGITQWIHQWKKRGWLTAGRKPVLNTDLWQRLDGATTRHEITWEWVKGHAGHADNETADRLAREAIAQGKEGRLLADPDA